MIPADVPFVPRRLHGVSHVLAVASGKGGVGKTTVSVNLALALSQTGASVGLYDADLYGPNVPLMLGVQRKQSAKGEIPVFRKKAAPYIPPLERFGLKVMSIGLIMGTNDAINPDPRMSGHIIRQTLQDVKWGLLDYLIIDMPPGTGEPQQTLFNTIRIDGVLVVTTPQDLSLMDASRSLAFFQTKGASILGMVENMSYLNCPHCAEPIEVFHRSEDRNWLIDGRELEVLGKIPMDSAISRGIGAGHPLMEAVPDSAEAVAFRELAERVQTKLDALSSK